MANISNTDPIKELAEETGMGQKETKTLVDGLLESVSGYLKQGNKVQPRALAPSRSGSAVPA